MPMRKRRHMAVFKDVMMAHAPVLTDATTSGGWIGWMTAKMTPATKAAKPLQRMRLEAVTFISLSSLRPPRGLAIGVFVFGEVAGPGLEGGQVAALHLHAASASHVTNAA